MEEVENIQKPISESSDSEIPAPVNNLKQNSELIQQTEPPPVNIKKHPILRVLKYVGLIVLLYILLIVGIQVFRYIKFKSQKPNQNVSSQNIIVTPFVTTDQSHSQNDNNVIVINFSKCAPEEKINVAPGSVSYNIIGIISNSCVMEYGSQVENPKWSGQLTNHCEIPQTLGALSFAKSSKGVDFSQIQEYCRKQ